MADPKKETKKEETMRRTGMTSEAYDKIHKGYELTQPENYKKVKDAIDNKDKKIIEERNKAKPVKKKSGGILKAAPNEGVTKLPKDVRNKMGFLKKGGKVKGYKDGGKVKKMKKCRMDGIALRGKTRAKQRSK
jgi:hypothetical protein